MQTETLLRRGSLNETRDLKRPVIVFVSAGVVLGVLLSFAGTTPRARLNILQATAILFFAAMLFRGGPAGLAEKGERGSRSCLGLAAAVVLAPAIFGSVLGLYFVSDDFPHVYNSHRALLESAWEWFAVVSNPHFSGRWVS